MGINIMFHVLLIISLLVSIKAFTIGSDFNFLLFLKHGKKYSRWYESLNRNTFIEDAEVTTYIPLSSLVPKEWVEWFYGCLSESSPFTWGDCNRSLVTASRFFTNASEVIDMQEGFMEDPAQAVTLREEADIFLGTIAGLGETYIDMEN